MMFVIFLPEQLLNTAALPKSLFEATFTLQINFKQALRECEGTLTSAKIHANVVGLTSKYK